MSDNKMCLYDSESDVAGKHALFINRTIFAEGQPMHLQYIVFCHYGGVGLSVLHANEYDDVVFFAQINMHEETVVYSAVSDDSAGSHIDYIRQQLELASAS
jgi:hypothetical protein